MNSRETKTDVHLRLLAIADRMGVPFNSLFKVATEDDLNAQREQWDALKKRAGKGSLGDVATILKSLPGRNRPPLKGDEWPPKKTARSAAPKARRAPAKRTKKVAA
jgi:hypothetical protein